MTVIVVSPASEPGGKITWFPKESVSDPPLGPMIAEAGLDDWLVESELWLPEQANNEQDNVIAITIDRGTVVSGKLSNRGLMILDETMAASEEGENYIGRASNIARNILMR